MYKYLFILITILTGFALYNYLSPRSLNNVSIEGLTAHYIGDKSCQSNITSLSSSTPYSNNVSMSNSNNVSSQHTKSKPAIPEASTKTQTSIVSSTPANYSCSADLSNLGDPIPLIKDGKGTLFLYPEALGFGVSDFGGFPMSKECLSKFHQIAVVANAAAVTASNPSRVLEQWNNSKIQAMANTVTPPLPIAKWIAYYFGPTSNPPFCFCNTKGCTGIKDKQPQNCDTCTQQVISDFCDWQKLTNNGIQGIIFDDEVGDAACIVKTLESVKSVFPNIKLGWSSSLGAAKNDSPRAEGNIIWDVCLGQAYTDNTLAMYAVKGCDFSDEFWNEVQKKYLGVDDSKGVPMVCGSGNCQEIYNCVDERMTGDQVCALLQQRPDSFPWKNFAIWYGTYANPSNDNQKTGSEYKVCTNNNVACKTQCCTDWEMLPPS